MSEIRIILDPTDWDDISIDEAPNEQFQKLLKHLKEQGIEVIPANAHGLQSPVCTMFLCG